MKQISIFLLVMLFAVPVFSQDDIILEGDGTQVIRDKNKFIS